MIVCLGTLLYNVRICSLGKIALCWLCIFDQAHGSACCSLCIMESIRRAAAAQLLDFQHIWSSPVFQHGSVSWRRKDIALTAINLLTNMNFFKSRSVIGNLIGGAWLFSILLGFVMVCGVMMNGGHGTVFNTRATVHNVLTSVSLKSVIDWSSWAHGFWFYGGWMI